MNKQNRMNNDRIDASVSAFLAIQKNQKREEHHKRAEMINQGKMIVAMVAGLIYGMSFMSLSWFGTIVGAFITTILVELMWRAMNKIEKET